MPSTPCSSRDTPCSMSLTHTWRNWLLRWVEPFHLCSAPTPAAECCHLNSVLSGTIDRSLLHNLSVGFSHYTLKHPLCVNSINDPLPNTDLTQYVTEGLVCLHKPNIRSATLQPLLCSGSEQQHQGCMIIFDPFFMFLCAISFSWISWWLIQPWRRGKWSINMQPFSRGWVYCFVFVIYNITLACWKRCFSILFVLPQAILRNYTKL